MTTNDKTLTRDQIEELARRFFDEAMAESESRLARNAFDDPDELDAEIRRVERRREGAVDLLARNDIGAASEVADDLLERAGLPVMRKAPEYADFCRLLLRANAEAAKLREAHLQGRYDAVPADPMFRRNGVPAAASLAPAASRTPPQEHAPLLFDLIDAHVKGMSREWTKQTKNQNDATFRMFKDHIGNRPVNAVARKDVSGFVASLASLPAKYGQLPRYRGKTLAAMVAVANAEPADIARLSKKTLNRHISAVSGLFSWAFKHGHWEGTSPAKGFIDKSGDGGPKRRPWRREELERLFASPIWTGPNRERDHRFFIPLVALFSGLRREEICKLRAEDVRETEGMWVIDVVETSEGRVKEVTSNRTVPVHPVLVRVGFVAHVQSTSAAGGGLLWSELKRGGPDNKLGDEYGKEFGRYCAKNGLKPERKPGDPLLDFHSFRHNVSTALRAAGVPESITSDILGHEALTESYRRYGEGAAVRPLYEAICKVDYGINLSRLYLAA